MRLVSLGVLCHSSLDPEEDVRPIIEQLFHDHKPNYRIIEPKIGDHQVVIWDSLSIDPTYDLREMREHIIDSIPNSDVFLVDYTYTKSYWESWGGHIIGIIGGAIGVIGIAIAVILSSD